jgi:hypothetical protein
VWICWPGGRRRWPLTRGGNPGGVPLGPLMDGAVKGCVYFPGAIQEFVVESWLNIPACCLLLPIRKLVKSCKTLGFRRGVVPHEASVVMTVVTCQESQRDTNIKDRNQGDQSQLTLPSLSCSLHCQSDKSPFVFIQRVRGIWFY